jgi:hypothetical protein
LPTWLNPQDFFKPTDELKNCWINHNTNHDLSLKEEWREFDSIFEKIKLRAYKNRPYPVAIHIGGAGPVKHAV